ncbi:hypothetical protein AR686_16875 [Chryseobacterium aquaticum subsp. greenlandense]|uniref:DUF6705 domain-containing protein n=2 Tax=Chryseobacterium aquaticum TaxID=452084 RepID=A0A101CEG1_9FLAO|nr:hypothetical protein AR686_16875 [Chryseobacterium aquaticum subsp. greenlandense]
MNCKSQTVIIRGQKNPNLPENFLSSGNYYYKDIYNYLDNFSGTWEYVNGNEKFQIILTKIVKYHLLDADLNYNIYEDGITFKYKKYLNNNLIYESPSNDYPSFTTENGSKLEGYINDYGRLTRTVYYPKGTGGGILKQGGEYFHPSCTIELLPAILTLNGGVEPRKIKFTLYIGETVGEYRNPAYSGMPTFSIPNDVVMTKVP